MFTCSICYDNLVSSDAPAAIHCGHTFHKKCIDHWLTLAQSRNLCPVCKRHVNKNRTIAHLYFSSNEESSSQPTTNISVNNNADTAVIRATLAEANNTADTMKRTIAELKQENSVIKSDMTKLQQDYERVKIVNTNQEKELKENQRIKRYLKQIKRVAELDDDLNSPASQIFMNSLNKLPKEDVIVCCGALRKQKAKSEESRERAEEKVVMLNKHHQLLSAKLNRLRNELKTYKNASTTSTSEVSSSSFTNGFNQTFQPRRSNVIVLDDSDDDEDEDEKEGEELARIEHSILDQDDDEDFIVQEHNPIIFNRNLKRRVDMSDEEGVGLIRTDQTSKIIRISDNDEDLVRHTFSDSP